MKRTRQRIFYGIVGALAVGVLLLPGFERPPPAVSPPAEQVASITPQPADAPPAAGAAAPRPTSGFALSANAVAIAAAVTELNGSAIALGAPRQAGATAGLRIGEQAVNLRTGPSTSYDAVQVAAAGTALTVLGRQGNWVQVQLADGPTGWVYGTYIAGDDAGTVVAAAPEAAAPPPAAAKPTTTASRQDMPSGRLVSAVVVRTAPDENAPTITRLSRGDRVTVAENRNGWLRVITSDGTTGWVYSPGSM